MQDFFGPLDRHGNLLHITTQWSLDTPLQGQLNLGIRQDLTSRIIADQGDRFDFIIALTTFPTQLAVGEFQAAGLYWHIRNDVSGIGRPLIDQSANWGSDGRLQGFIDLGHASLERLTPVSVAYRHLLETVMHEIMHRWSSYVRYVDGNGSVQQDLLGHMDAHWHSLLDSQASVMYGHEWSDIANSEFRSGPVRRRYSELDMYLAGLAGPNEVAPFLRLRNSQPTLSEFPAAGQLVQADSETLTIDQIIDAEGPRLPAVVSSQKHFRAAMVLVSHPDEQIPAGTLAAMERLRRDVQRRFSSMTQGRGVLHIVPEVDNATAPGLPGTLIGSTESGTNSVDVELALDWLEQEQLPGGFWVDRNGSRWRDTAVAMEVLRLLRPAFPGLDVAEQSLNDAVPETWEAEAWRGRAFSGQIQVSGLIAELSEQQRADGGWGLTDEHGSSVEDTASVLLAFWDLLPQQAIDAATEFLAVARNEDGGWGHYAGSGTRFPPTLSALEALSLPVAAYPDALEAGQDWIISAHRPTGEFRHNGETFPAGDAARALTLLIGQDVVPDTFDSTAQWFSRQQGQDGDWGGSAYSTARVLLLLGLLELPNLRVMGQPFSLPEAPTVGSLARLTARIGNSGRQTAPASTLRWYLGDPRQDGEPVSGAIELPEMTPGSSVLIRHLLDTADLDGEQEVWVVADDSNEIEEWTRQDNYGRLVLNLGQPPEIADLDLHPDAVVMSPATIGSIPSEVRVTGTLRNLGLTDAQGATLALIDRGVTPQQNLVSAQYDVMAQGQVAFDLSFNHTGEQSGQLLLIADPSEQIPDPDRSNNQVELTLNVFTGIDVAVESIHLEPAGATHAGHPLTIAVDIANLGLAAATPFVLEIEVLDQADNTVHSAEATLSLDAQTITRRTFAWQAAEPGIYMIHAIADGAEVLDDVDTSNNSFESQYTVTVAEGINLRLDPLSVVAMPEPALEAGEFNVSAIVHSDGGDPSPTFSLGLFDGDPRSGAQLLGEVTHPAPLSPGDSVELNIELQSLTLRGQHTLWLKVDPFDEFEQTNNEDDLHAFGITALSLPDVAVQTVDLTLDPAVPVEGQPVTLEARIHNLGQQAAEHVRVDLYESTTISETLVETRMVELVAGESLETVSWNWTYGMQDAAEILRVVIDPDDEIHEQTPANNSAELVIDSGGGPLFASNRYFSPNGDGVKDETLLVFRLDQPRNVVLTLEQSGEVIKTFEDYLAQLVDRGQVVWDGRDDFGDVVTDGEYLVRLISMGEEVATTIVTVDTDRTPMIDAQQRGRVFHNQIHGFRQGSHEPIPVNDSELGVGYVLMNPYSIDLESDLTGIYKTGVRTLEPVISNAWIQSRSAVVGESVLPQTLAYDGERTLAILARGDSGYEVWLTELSRTDQVVVHQLDNIASQAEIVGFAPTGELILLNGGLYGVTRTFMELSPSTGLVRESDLLTGNLDQWTPTLIADGVLYVSGSTIYFAPYDGPIAELPFDGGYFNHVELRSSPSGNFASIHYQFYEFEGIAVFDLAEVSINDVTRTEQAVDYFYYNCVYGPSGELIAPDTFAFGADWSPTMDKLGIVDSIGGKVMLWSSLNTQSFEIDLNEAPDYAQQVEVEDGQRLIHEGISHSVQHMRTKLGDAAECGPPGDTPSGNRGFDQTGDLNVSTGLLWDESGARLMFVTSDLVWARIEDGLSTFLIPGQTKLRMLNVRSGEFSDVSSDSLWPYEGQTGQPIVPGSDHYGYDLHFTKPFEIPRYYWWSARKPQVWFNPIGPFSVDQYWGAEAGYFLVDLECPQQPGVPGGKQCLPVPVINLDHPAVRLQSVVGVGDIDLGGFATDRNLQGWRIDMSSSDGLDPWRQVTGWTDSDIIDSRFLRWPPNTSGAVLLRLELLDQAGNKSQAFRRTIIPLQPLEPVIEMLNAEPRQISPNGDGRQDSVELRYLALRAEPFKLRILDQFGNEVYRQVISHLPDELGEHVLHWSGESSASGIVDDGEYELELWSYSIPVLVDTQAPSGQFKAIVPPYLPRPPLAPGGTKVPAPGAVLKIDVSDASPWTGILEYRVRNGTLEWFEHGSLRLYSGISKEDYLSKEFRFRVADSAGNETLQTVEWPGDFIVLLGVKDIEGTSLPDLKTTISPERLNDPDDTIVSGQISRLRINPQIGLELEFADLAQVGVDQLSIQYRSPESEIWIDYEADLVSGRNDSVILPLGLLPGPKVDVRLVSADLNLYSNILRLSMEVIGEPDCYSPLRHAGYFDDLDVSTLPQDGSLVFWQAFSSPEFELRELHHIVPGQPTKILEPVAIGAAGGRLYHVPIASTSGVTVVARVRRTSGEVVILSADLDCAMPSVGMSCYRQDSWFGQPLPAVSPITHALMMMEPHLTDNVDYAEVFQAEPGGSYSSIDAILFGDGDRRLYRLDVTAEYALRYRVLPDTPTIEVPVFADCFSPNVTMVTVPSPLASANAGEASVRIGLPDPDNPELTFSHIRVELQTAGGVFVETLLDEIDPPPIYDDDPDCPVAPVLGEGRIDLSQLPPGGYRFVSTLTSENGAVWEWIENFTVHAQPAALAVQYPADQSLLCLDEQTQGGMKIQIGQSLDPGRVDAAIIELEGHPSMVPEQGFRTIHADGILLDRAGLTASGQGDCVADADSSYVAIVDTFPLSAGVPEIEIGIPPSPQQWNGVLGLNFNVVDRAGGRSSEQRTVQIDSRLEIDEAAAVPKQPWSQFQTPMLSLDGQASLREVTYQALTHESLNVEMRVYAVTPNAQGQFIEDDEASLTESPVIVPGPSTPALSPAQFELSWNGELDEGVAPDGFYHLRPVLQDGCRTSHPAGKLVEVDSTGPAITVSFPQPGQTIETSLLEVIGTVEDKYFESYRVVAQTGAGSVVLNESENSVVEPGTLALADISGLDGPGTVIIQASDRLGNSSELQIPVTFSPPAPLIQGLTVNPMLFGPNGNGMLDSTAVVFSLVISAEVSLAITDSNGATQASLLAAEPMGAGEHIFEWFGDDLAGNVLSDGSYRVELMASALSDPTHEGEAGHDVKVDTTPPVVEFVYPDLPYVQGLGYLEVSVEDLHPRTLMFDLQDEAGLTIESSEIVLSDSLEQYGLVELDNLEEGAYRIEVTAIDRAENRTEEVLEVTIDRTPPELELSEPVESSHLRPGEVYLIAGSVDDPHLQHWELTVALDEDEPEWQILHHSDQAPATTELFEWLVELVDGDYLLRLSAIDHAGNENEIVVDIVIDGTLPEVSLTAPAESAWAGPELEISGTADDLHLASYRLSLVRLESGEISGSWIAIAVSDNPVTDDTLATVRPPVTGGSYRLLLEAWDQAGNLNQVSRDFNYIAAPPPPPDELVADVVNQNDVHLAWIGNQLGVPLAGFHVVRDGTRLTEEAISAITFVDPGLPDATYHYTVVAVDIAGNESDQSLPALVTVRQTAPQVQIHNPVSGETIRGLYEVRGTATSEEVFAGFQLWAESQAGPVQLIAESVNQVTSGMLGLFDTRIFADGSSVILRLEASDHFGNHALVTTDILIDNLAPQPPTGLTAEVVDGENVQLQWNAGSEPDLLGYVLYRNGNPVNWSGTLPDDLRLLAFPATDYLDEVVPDGIHTYRVFAIDEAGNISAASDSAQAELDRKPPDLVIVEPLPGYVFETSLRVTAQGEDIDIAQVQFAYRLEGEPDWLIMGEPIIERPYRISWTPGEIPWGRYEIQALATDTGGLSDPEPPMVLVEYADLTPPQVPAGLAAVVDGTEVTLSWQPVPDEDLAEYRVYRGGAQVNTDPVTTTGYVDIAPWANGDLARIHEYRISAVDESDNESAQSGSVEARVHQPFLEQPYTPTPNQETALAGYSALAGTLSGTVTGDGPGAALPETLVDAEVPFEVSGIALGLGTNALNVVVEDVSGNRSIPAEVSVVHGLPPEPPEGLVVDVIADELVVDWTEHTDPDVIGYRVFRNGNGVPADESAPAPLDALSNYDNPWRALDGSFSTAWGDSYAHTTAQSPYLEIQFDQLQLISEVELNWKPGRHAVDFDLFGWSGEVWSPLERIRGNQSSENYIFLDQPYRTDRLRLEIIALTGTGWGRLGLAEFDPTTRPLLGEPGWNSDALLPGLYQVQVSAINHLGFESDRTVAIEAGVGDVQAPEPVAVTADVDGYDVELSWSENTTDDVDHYRVLRDGVEIAQVAFGEPTTYVDEALVNGTYDYIVLVVSVAGIPSAPSNLQTVEVDVDLPSVPEELTLTAPTSGSALQLDWTPGSGVLPATYRINRALAEAGPYETIAEVATTAYLDGSLYNGQKYFYTVEALDSAGNSSGPSAPVSGTPVNLSVPEAPRFLYPGMNGQVLVTPEHMLILTGQSQPNDLVEVWRGDSLLGLSIASPGLEFTPLNVSEVTSFNGEIIPGDRWVWMNTQSGDRIVDTFTGEVLGPWSERAYLAAWDLAHGQLWRRELWGATQYEVVELASGISKPLPLPLEVIYFASPAPDGQWALLAGRLVANDPLGMFRWNRETEELQLLEATSYTDFNSETSTWSPDSSHVAWVRGGRLRVLDLQSGTFDQYGSSMVQVRPVWSPNSRYVAVVNSLFSVSDIRVFDIQTGTVWEPPAGSESRRLPHWSSDGSQLSMVAGNRVEVFEFPSGALLHQIDFEELGDDLTLRGWQRPMEMLVSHGDEAFVELMALPGWFRIDDIELVPGENPLVGYATNVDGNRSNASGELVLILEEQSLPDLAVANHELIIQPSGGSPGDEFIANAIIRNLGGSVSSESHGLMILILPNGSERTEIVDVPSLAPGQSVDVEWDLSALDTIGVYDVLIEIDPLGEIVEATRDNNLASRQFVVGDANQPMLELTATNDRLLSGQPLEAQMRVVNPGSTFTGEVELAVYDETGLLMVDLGSFPINSLAPGGTWLGNAEWLSEGVLAGNYVLQGRLLNSFGQELQNESVDFAIQLDAQVALTLIPEQSVLVTGTTARIQVGVNLLHSNGLIAQSVLELSANDANGVPLRQWSRNLGTLLPGYQSTETVLWPLTDVPLGTHSLRLELSSSSVHRTAVSSLTVVETSGVEELTGSVAFTQSPLQLGQAPLVEWQVAMPSGATNPNQTLRLNLVTLPANNVIDSFEFDTTIQAGGSEAGQEMFNTVLGQQGDYAVVLDAWNEDEQTWLWLASHSSAALDQTPPEITILQPQSGEILAIPFTLQAQIVDSFSFVDEAHYRIAEDEPWEDLLESGLGDYFAVLEGLADGEYDIAVRATDTAGNIAITQPRNIVIDSTPPEIVITGISDQVTINSPVVPVIEVSDAHLDETTMTLNGLAFASGATVAEEGAYQLEVEATDLAGNSSQLSIQFVLDFTPPTIEFVEPDEGTVLVDGEVDVVLQTDPGETVSLSRGAYETDQVADSQGLATFLAVPLELGENLLSATAVDLAGNESDIVSRTVHWLSATEALQGTILPDSEQFAADDQISGVVELHNGSDQPLSEMDYRFRVWHDDALAPLSEWTGTIDIPANTTAEFGWSFASVGWPLGELRLVLEIFDATDWIESDIRTVLLVDLVAPELVVVEPEPGQIIGAMSDLLADASDIHSAIESVQWSLDGAPWLPMAPDGAWPNRYRAELSDLAEGKHSLSVQAEDEWGNQAGSGPVLFAVDKTAPVIAISGVLDGEATNESVTPVIKVKDISPVTTEIELNGQLFESGTTVDDEGTYQLLVEAADIAGNEAELQIMFVIDRTEPEITFTHPDPGTVIVVGPMLLSGITEPGSEVHLVGPVSAITTYADAAGVFEVPDWPLEPGANAISAYAIDPAGNEGPISSLEVSYKPEYQIFQDRFEGIGMISLRPVLGLAGLEPVRARSLRGLEWHHGE